LWIHIDFDADPDPVQYHKADPDQNPGSQTKSMDPDPGKTLPSQKVEFLHEKY
jgi:hypothetical protein